MNCNGENVFGVLQYKSCEKKVLTSLCDTANKQKAAIRTFEGNKQCLTVVFLQLSSYNGFPKNIRKKKRNKPGTHPEE